RCPYTTLFRSESSAGLGSRLWHEDAASSPGAVDDAGVVPGDGRGPGQWLRAHAATAGFAGGPGPAACPSERPGRSKPGGGGWPDVPQDGDGPAAVPGAP